MKRIGIMGGTFDPPHIGHLQMAQYAADKLSLEKVIFLPTGRIYYKTERTSPEDRLCMTKLAISENPVFEVSDIETSCDVYSYTANSLEKLKAMFLWAQLYFIVGADSLDYMESWKNPDKLFSLCTVVVVFRHGYTREQSLKKAEELKIRFGADIVFADMPRVDISSSEIRDRLRRGESVSGMVNEGVLEYIRQKNLYSGEDR